MPFLERFELWLGHRFGWDFRRGNAREVLIPSGFFLMFVWACYLAYLSQPWRIAINSTTSAPQGLYLVHFGVDSEELHRKAVVLIKYTCPKPCVAPFNQFHDGDQFLKTIAGVPGDRLAFEGNTVVLTEPDGERDELGSVLDHTPSGVPIPYHATFPPTPIPEGMYYMGEKGNPAAYDSRYFGLVPESRVLGTARLLWAFFS